MRRIIWFTRNGVVPLTPGSHIDPLVIHRTREAARVEKRAVAKGGGEGIDVNPHGEEITLDEFIQDVFSVGGIHLEDHTNPLIRVEIEEDPDGDFELDYNDFICHSTGSSFHACEEGRRGMGLDLGDCKFNLRVSLAR